MENWLNQTQRLSADQVKAEQARFMVRVYGWMTAALVVTALASMYVASSQNLIELIILNRFAFYGLIIAEIGIVWYLSSRVQSMTANTATLWFFLYALLNGLTLAVIFLIYSTSSITSTFFITAGTFGIMSAYGYFTKSDLTSWGNLLFMALIGLIIAGVVNIFLRNDMFGMIISGVGVLIFVGLTAYDTQKIKEMNIIGNEGTDEDRKEAVMGALTLYLDFINLFLYLLRFMGKRD
jgi:uncharacterized protein